MKEIITDITTYKLTDITGLTDEEYDTLITNALAEKAAQNIVVNRNEGDDDDEPHFRGECGGWANY